MPSYLALEDQKNHEKADGDGRRKIKNEPCVVSARKFMIEQQQQ